MAIEIEKVGSVELERTGENVETDKYHIRYTGEDAPDHTSVEEKDVNGRTIGCSRCNVNTFAYFKGDEYICSVCQEVKSEIDETDLKLGFLKKSIK